MCVIDLLVNTRVKQEIGISWDNVLGSDFGDFVIIKTEPISLSSCITCVMPCVDVVAVMSHNCQQCNPKNKKNKKKPCCSQEVFLSRIGFDLVSDFISKIDQKRVCKLVFLLKHLGKQDWGQI